MMHSTPGPVTPKPHRRIVHFAQLPERIPSPPLAPSPPEVEPDEGTETPPSTPPLPADSAHPRGHGIIRLVHPMHVGAHQRPPPEMDSVHAMTLAKNHGLVPRPIPHVHRVPSNARQPIEPPTMVLDEMRPANTQDRRRWADTLAYHTPEPGFQAGLQTEVLQQPPPPSWSTQIKGTVQAWVDALLPAEKRHLKDSQRLAAGLRDSGEVAIDDHGRDVLMHHARPESNRLQRLGFRNTLPNLGEDHWESVQEMLARRSERQLAGEIPQEPLTKAVRRALDEVEHRR